MSRLVVLCLCIAAATAATIGDKKDSRIVGGVEALPDEYPYVVTIQRNFVFWSSHVCGGSILNGFHVLSSANCFFNNLSARYRVQAGKLRLNAVEATEQTIQVQRITIHPGYNGGISANDIAILRLASPFGFTDSIQPVVLPTIDTIPSGVVRIAGWGSTSMGLLPSMPNILQQTRVAIVPNLECQILMGGSGIGPVNEDMVCVGPITGGIGTCDGDSGNPVVQVVNQQYVQVGIVGWHPRPCGHAGIPSGGARVSAFIEWINLNAEF
ncbi:trypsin-1-like [Wyeomyia smithii]|uniref:trypsin-1-like n=1 Tax=Wyeomyia smithii TaxID=174621 RepID=UPI0024680D2E|nr:trypsin-1-like [Wyeomyia smithii]